MIVMQECYGIFTQFVPPSGRVWVKPDIRPRGSFEGLWSLLATKNGNIFCNI